MNLLYANDRRGEYPESWYAATADPLPPFQPLAESRAADVCVVGGGFTGLSTALALAEAGQDVVLLEAQRVGFGASGRNGGQVGMGQRKDQVELERLYGADAARALWTLAEDAKAEVKRLIAAHGIDAAWRYGVAHLDWTEAGAREAQDYADYLARNYGTTKIEPLDRAAARAMVGSDAFQGGLIDWSAGHIHPLRFALGLATAAQNAGVRIHERTEVSGVTPGQPGQWRVDTPEARITARHVILACNGYHGGLDARIAKRVLPINNFILVTEPLGDRVNEVLTKDIAAADSKFVVNYWRLTEDKRLLFGGGESYGDRFPADITSAVRKPMLEIYPQLADVRIDYAWGGTLAITPSRMPYFAELEPDLWTAGGYSGHGVALATLAGRLIAAAIGGDRQAFDTMALTRPPAFPGLGLIRRPLLNLAMRWFAFRDRAGF